MKTTKKNKEKRVVHVHCTSLLSHIYADQQDTLAWKTLKSRQMRMKRKYLCNMTDGYLHVQIHIQTKERWRERVLALTVMGGRRRDRERYIHYVIE